MTINSEEIKFLRYVRDACNQYLSKQINFYYFQGLIEANFKNWETDVTRNTKVTIHNLIVDLEDAWLDHENNEEGKYKAIELQIKEVLAYINAIPEMQKSENPE